MSDKPVPAQESEHTAELAAALAKAQGMMRHAIMDRINPHYRSKYATLNSVWDAIREPLSSNGLSITQTTSFLNGDAFVLVTTLRHVSGQWVASIRPLPIGKPQEMGSAETYAKRYAICSIVGITADEDDDGNAAGGKDKDTGEVISEAQTDTIRKLIAETKSDVTKFLQWAGAESISDIRASRFAEAIALLQAKKTQGKS